LSLPRVARLAGLLGLAACGSSTIAVDPIFIDGRSVSSSGDSLIAVTRSGRAGILVRRRQGGGVRELGTASLHSPWHIQWSNGEWYVSDIENGKPSVVVLSQTGELRRRVALERYTATPHQFAVLPDGRIVVEAPEGKLLAVGGDTNAVFTVTDRAAKTGLLVAAGGGVLHAVPDRYITLYNGLGHIRWRLEWPWARTAYVTEIAVDPQSRIHVLAGVPNDGTFIVYSMSNLTGEVVIWSLPSRKPTFIVDRLGQIKPTETEKWVK
jgi:hypothetical protein